jgi:isopenicillin-N N-acyltransferase-like protein
MFIVDCLIINPMAQRTTLLVVLCALLLHCALSNNCESKPNPFPTIDANFTKVGSHQFGEKYIYRATDMDQYFSLIRVWGNSYQAGFAYGSLMRKELS